VVFTNPACYRALQEAVKSPLGGQAQTGALRGGVWSRMPAARPAPRAITRISLRQKSCCLQNLSMRTKMTLQNACLVTVTAPAAGAMALRRAPNVRPLRAMLLVTLCATPTLSCASQQQSQTEAPAAKPATLLRTDSCSSGGAALWDNLEACGWPGPTNTGADPSKCPGGVLVNNSGANTRTIKITTPGAVVSCQNITGSIEVAAPGVIIENDIIAYDGGGASATGVVVIDDGDSATVDHVELNGLDHTHACIFDAGSKSPGVAHSMVAKSVNCHDIDDGIFSWWWPQSLNLGDGSDFIIENSYFHDFTENAANGHIDGYQTEGARDGVIIHNTYKVSRVPGDPNVPGGDIDSAMAIWDDFNESVPTNRKGGHYKIMNNLIAGGGFAMYAEDSSPGDGAPGDPSPVGGNSLTDVVYTNNSFSTYLNPCVGLYGVWFERSAWPPYYGGPTDGWHRSGNVVLELGLNVDDGNPPGCN
jgi:hypothetical protein